MQTKVFKCQKHDNQQVTFFCTVNQWHFIPLCPQCIPPHTQNHPKNFKVTIQSYGKVRQKSFSQTNSAIQQYNKRLSVISAHLSSQKSPEIYHTLQETKRKTIDLIEGYFSGIKKLLDQRLQDTLKFQIDLLQKLQNNVKADISDLQNLDQINDANQWADIVKRLYFKDGITPYLEQIDEIIKDHQERVFKRKDLSQINFKKYEEDIKKVLQSNIFLNKQNHQQNSEQKPKTAVKDTKKQPKISIKPKICKICNGQLEYLTQLKKHLYCPNCGGKQRNYTKKT